MEIEYFKLMYVFNYPKLLNFKDIYKKIINPYFIYPKARYKIEDEGSHSEFIEMTFPDSYCQLVFSYGSIEFYYDGSYKDLLDEDSRIDICFDIFDKLKKQSDFLKVSAEKIKLVAFKQLHKDKAEIISDFVKKHNVYSRLGSLDDISLAWEETNGNLDLEILCGLFNPENDIDSFDLFTLSNQEKITSAKSKNGIITTCDISRETSIVSKDTFKDIVQEGKKRIEEILKNYE